MSDKKLSLDDLKVQSFVTSLTEEENFEVRGGLTRMCDSDTATACTSLVYCDSGTWHGCWPPEF